MSRTMGVLACVAALGGVASGCGDDEADAGAAGVPTTLRMAVTDLQGLEELQREFGAFKSEFERSAGVKLDFFPVADRTAAAAAIAGDRVDLVFTGPAEYVVMHERTEAEPVIAIRRPDYHACVYVKQDSDVQALIDLKGKKVGMSDIGSTSGHLGPSQLFVDAGMTPEDDIETLPVGDAVHQALERGDVDAVGVGCHDRDEYIEGEEGKFRTVTEGPPLPPDIILAHPDLSDAAVNKVRSTFQANWPALLKGLLEGKDNAKYDKATLVEVEDSDYDVVRSMYRAIGVDDFSGFVGDG